MDDYQKLRIEAWIRAYEAHAQGGIYQKETASDLADKCVEALDERFGPSVKETAPEPEVEPKVCAWRRVSAGLPGEHFVTGCGVLGTAPQIGSACESCGGKVQLMVTANDEVETCRWYSDPSGHRSTVTDCGRVLHPKHKVAPVCPRCDRSVTHVEIEEPAAQEVTKLAYCTWRECAITGLKNGQCGARAATPAAMPEQCPGCARPVAVGPRLNEEETDAVS